MYTLTYRPSVLWSPNQIGDFCRWLRKEYDRCYVWVAELTKRGRMHYHVLTSIPEGERWDKDKIEFEWYFGLVWVTDEVKNKFYVGKYLQKGKGTNGYQYPKGARLVGYHGVTRALSDRANRERCASRLPGWVRGGVDKREIREAYGGFTRDRGGFRFGGTLAVSPYSTHELPAIDEVSRRMRFAWTGIPEYNYVDGELPQTTQLSERIG